jgi:hypothetical protein
VVAGDEEALGSFSVAVSGGGSAGQTIRQNHRTIRTGPDDAAIAHPFGDPRRRRPPEYPG